MAQEVGDSPPREGVPTLYRILKRSASQGLGPVKHLGVHLYPSATPWMNPTPCIEGPVDPTFEAVTTLWTGDERRRETSKGQGLRLQGHTYRWGQDCIRLEHVNPHTKEPGKPWGLEIRSAEAIDDLTRIGELADLGEVLP